MLTAVAERMGLRTGPLNQRLRDAMVHSIRDGLLPANRALPSERDLAVGLGVSRSSVRKCLKDLSDMGLVETRHGAGSVVRAFIPKAWRPIEAAVVARALLRSLSRPEPGVVILESAALQDLGA